MNEKELSISISVTYNHGCGVRFAGVAGAACFKVKSMPESYI